MSFQQGLSGLNGAQRSLDAIGNNVANSGTVGFKLSQAQFADVYAAALGAGGGSQIGIGTSVSTVSQQFTQGNLTVTNNPLDVAINGAGFYRMSSNGAISYTRNGQFNIDKEGFIVNASGGPSHRFRRRCPGHDHSLVAGGHLDRYVGSDTQARPRWRGSASISIRGRFRPPSPSIRR
ncbi:MAG: flagellar hook-basal body complex protein [Comamonadaceae bacterium]|nr:flagellar hook-basal body complex protein [Comamonadaceae bacterium]